MEKEEKKIMYCKKMRETFFAKILSILISTTFLFSNLTFAQDLPAKANTLATYYISQLLTESERDLEKFTRDATPVSGRTIKDRVDEFGRAWVAKSAELLAEKMVRKVKELGNMVSIEDAERELIRQLQEYSKKKDIPRYRSDTLIAAIRHEFASLRAPVGPTTIRLSASGVEPTQGPIIDDPLLKKLQSLHLPFGDDILRVIAADHIFVNGKKPVPGAVRPKEAKVEITYKSPLKFLRRKDNPNGQHFYMDNYPSSELQLRMLRAIAGLMGITTNLSIFQKSAAQGAFDSAIGELVDMGITDTETVYDTVTMEAFRKYAQLIAQLTQEAGTILGTASYEVPPPFIHDVAATMNYQQQITYLGPSVVMVKTPSTAAGFEAIRQNATTKDVVRDNLTLMFGFDQWIESQLVQIEKLEERVNRGLPVDKYFGVDSFFLSRTDIFMRAIFEALKKQGVLSEKDAERFDKIKDLIAVAQAKIVGRWNNYIYFNKPLPEETPGPPILAELKVRFEKVNRLALQKGLGPIRPRVPLWASTMVKEADVKRGVDQLLYFVNLIMPNSVNTMPDGLIGAIEERFKGMTDEEKKAAIEKLDNAINDDRIIVKYDPKGKNTYAPQDLTPAKIIETANELLGKYTQAILVVQGTHPSQSKINIRQEIEAYNARLKGLVDEGKLSSELYKKEMIELTSEFRFDLDKIAKILTWRGGDLFEADYLKSLATFKEKIGELAKAKGKPRASSSGKSKTMQRIDTLQQLAEQGDVSAVQELRDFATFDWYGVGIQIMATEALKSAAEKGNEAALQVCRQIIPTYKIESKESRPLESSSGAEPGGALQKPQVDLDRESKIEPEGVQGREPSFELPEEPKKQGRASASGVAIEPPGKIALLAAKDKEEMSRSMAERIVDEVRKANKVGRKVVLGLATGGTMERVYEIVVKMTEKENLDWSNVVTFNLDEYKGLPPDHKQSYRYFMDSHLFNHLKKYGLDIKNTHVFNGMSKAAGAELKYFVANIEREGIDLQILGIGSDGHYAFLEPAVVVDEKLYKALSTGKLTQEEVERVMGFNDFIITDDSLDVQESAIRSVTEVKRRKLSELGKEARLIAAVKQAWEKENRQIDELDIGKQLTALGNKLLKEQALHFYIEGLDSEKRTALSARLGELPEYMGRVELHDRSSFFGSRAKVTDLALPTIIDNSRYFLSLTDVPIQAFTLTGVVRDAEHIVLAANGPGKANAVAGAMVHPVTEEVTSSILQTHPDTTFIIAKDALGRVPEAIKNKAMKNSVVLRASSSGQAKVVSLPYFVSGIPATDEVIAMPSMAADLTTTVAAAVIEKRAELGLVTEATPKDKAKEIKTALDSVAKRIIEKLIYIRNAWVHFTVSEGIGRDHVLESFIGGEAVGATDGTPYYMAIDIIEGTNATASGKMGIGGAGGSSIAVEGEGVSSLGFAPDIYADLIITHVPKDKIAQFKKAPLDPYTPDSDGESAVYAKVISQLRRIAEANRIGIENLEIVIMIREREKLKDDVLKRIEREHPGFTITRIQDGTFMHGVDVALGRMGEKHKVMWTVGGLPEGFMNLLSAKPFRDEGAVAGLRICSKNINNSPTGKETATDMSWRYNFTEEERADLERLRPTDNKDIISGGKLFTLYDIEGPINGSFSFITDNGVFGIPGVRVEGDKYRVATLRIREVEGKGYMWLEDILVSSVKEVHRAEGRVGRNEFELREAINKGREKAVQQARQKLEEAKQALENAIGQVSKEVVVIANNKGAGPAGPTRASSSSSVSQQKAAKGATLPEVAIQGLETQMREITTHMVLRPEGEGAIDFSKVTVIMKKDLPEAITGEKAALLSETLKDRYQVMKQNFRKVFSGDRGVIEVTTQEELLSEANALIGKGIKVIVLDDGSLTKGLNESSIQGKPGESYSVVTTDALPQDLDVATIPFVNLNAMALMGIGILYNDISLFETAYEAFTGNKAPEDYIAQLKNKLLWIIRALPRIVKFANELKDQEGLKKLFAVAA